MIAYLHPVTGLLPERDFQQKLFKMPRIVAGMSYWGAIGLVVRREPLFKTFADWMRAHISLSNPKNLKEFAEELADRLNAACDQKPLPKDASMGVHVAGYQEWSDGKPRPTFYHVHNGHLHTEWSHPDTPQVIAVDPTGRCILGGQTPSDADEVNRRPLLDERIVGRTEMEPRGLFEAHLDFPKESRTLADNEAALSRGYVTANGEYFRYSVSAQRSELSELRNEDLPPVDVPQDSNQSTGALLQTIHAQAKSLIGEIAFEKPPPTFGGRLWKLGINASGYVGCDERL